MATYGSYKKIANESLQAATVESTYLATGAAAAFGVQWVFNERGLCCQNCSNAGGCVEQANGKCCLWTVPAAVTSVTFEIWSGGGGGAGMICCNCCGFSIGGAGGNYAVKTIQTVAGCQYTICAGGSWPCAQSHTCAAGMGCLSYITGFNLSNFCVVGGCGGWMCDGDAWGPRHHDSGCANCNICGYFGADFGMMGSVGLKMGHGACHCYRTASWTGTAPIIGKTQAVGSSETWCSCGCYVNWPSGGGMSGTSSYCGNFAKQCAGGQGQGGSGIVRITYY
jgi:hypothetical protein